MNKFTIHKISDGKKEKVIDWITEEVPLTINVNGHELATLLCSPTSLRELAVGFLFSSGLIKSLKDITAVRIDEKHWQANITTVDELDFGEKLLFKRMYTSGCGRGILFYNSLDKLRQIKLTLKKGVYWKRVLELMAQFQQSSAEFKKTGGVHSAALCGREKIIARQDDIGRHNAVDKIIGEALLKKLDLSSAMLLLSGRISSEIFYKLNKCGIPIIASVSAPTDQAVKLARKLNVTLIGFARGKRFNVYSSLDRIIMKGK
ncbi:formate dehydrogenase family accessory protein FdhD [candidate division WOR-1 bacterium RIFOXYA12_FULL_52_29]|uniref:Sulfur carrier protein FdhD n=1 Tax=candidate division WOR-1 bacterium RIFOXYC12_FULL_54_18 TaxID=1802584 RepID=A0A1F4T549_UNCSA|nr:MAG: formate dehydrogenase family accessory protein FdhD [candidate division WOR-1 bacterium RIFOXYA2_FULL_51_19]OGC17269.1 MAG: formate dehydrogenase family accessory protein FdhD [candidate division WOR-1 bacterium RIFOXYA12_FULL_52_29]OGC26129.1 MAG: formate dehydrogenase family accessory protein FdhD [candidate division WOR-1 bacterium RIFOXYB2_FULL_45_9]OGC27686.1 MAG: formate dehydrogenase family accessory protein FdhD [candidate division WOR-1 bacterium RIFOXYC12_FULL_54_18]OGC30023.1